MKKFSSILFFIVVFFPIAVTSSNVGGEKKQLEEICDKENPFANREVTFRRVSHSRRKLADDSYYDSTSMSTRNAARSDWFEGGSANVKYSDRKSSRNREYSSRHSGRRKYEDDDRGETIRDGYSQSQSEYQSRTETEQPYSRNDKVTDELASLTLEERRKSKECHHHRNKSTKEEETTNKSRYSNEQSDDYSSSSNISSRIRHKSEHRRRERDTRTMDTYEQNAGQRHRHRHRYGTTTDYSYSRTNHSGERSASGGESAGSSRSVSRRERHSTDSREHSKRSHSRERRKKSGDGRVKSHGKGGARNNTTEYSGTGATSSASHYSSRRDRGASGGRRKSDGRKYDEGEGHRRSGGRRRSSGGRREKETVKETNQKEKDKLSDVDKMAIKKVMCQIAQTHGHTLTKEELRKMPIKEKHGKEEKLSIYEYLNNNDRYHKKLEAAVLEMIAKRGEKKH